VRRFVPIVFLRCRRVFSNLPAAKWLAPGKDIVYDLRKMINNSTLSRNLEQAVTRYVAWLERQAPGAWEAMKAFRTPQK